MSCDHGRAFLLVAAEIDAMPSATLRTIAVRLRIHPQTVAAIIRDATGLKAECWRQRRLAEKAHHGLVDHPEMSIKEIAARFGMTTNGLRRLMQRQYGLTSTRIRSIGRTGS